MTDGQRADLGDVGVGEPDGVAGVLEVAAFVGQAQRDGVVAEQRAALLGVEVAEELGDEGQPQRVVPRPARVLVQPRAGGGGRTAASSLPR